MSSGVGGSVWHRASSLQRREGQSFKASGAVEADMEPLRGLKADEKLLAV